MKHRQEGFLQACATLRHRILFRPELAGGVKVLVLYELLDFEYLEAGA